MSFAEVSILQVPFRQVVATTSFGSIINWEEMLLKELLKLGLDNNEKSVSDKLVIKEAL